MQAFVDCDIWTTLTPRQRRRVRAAVLASDAQPWLVYHVPAALDAAALHQFARRNLLRGFFGKPGWVLLTAATKPADTGVDLWIAVMPAPRGVALPCWACGVLAALRMTFGDVAPVSRRPVYEPGL